MINELPIAKLCEKQLKDINPEDILNDGLYRICDVYKGGGGYDKFPAIVKRRLGINPNPKQFVAQVHGCSLRCPYCYVTKDGYKEGDVCFKTIDELVDDYNKTGLDVFHLMGGAPALYLNKWRALADKVKLFHSDFLLVEKPYKEEWVKDLPGLHAVSIKEKYIYNATQMKMMLKNLNVLLKANVNFYITFTGEPELKPLLISEFGNKIFEDSFTIKINWNYKALENTK